MGSHGSMARCTSPRSGRPFSVCTLADTVMAATSTQYLLVCSLFHTQAASIIDARSLASVVPIPQRRFTHAQGSAYTHQLTLQSRLGNRGCELDNSSA